METPRGRHDPREQLLETSPPPCAQAAKPRISQEQVLKRIGDMDKKIKEYEKK